MKLSELPKGNAFVLSDLPGGQVRFTCKGFGVPEMVPTIAAETYFVMDPLTKVIPIAPMDEFDNGIGFTMRDDGLDLVPLESVDPGVVCAVPGGLVHHILKTKHMALSGRVVCGLRYPDMLDGETPVDDLGAAEDHNGLPWYAKVAV